MTSSAPAARRPTPESALLKRRAFIAVVVVIALTIVGFVLKAAGPLELPVSQAFNGLHQGALGVLASLFYNVIGPVPAIVGTALLTVVIFVVRRDLGVASTFAATIAGTWIPVIVIKTLVGRSRPDSALLPYPYSPFPHDTSYPSGHATFVTALVLTCLLMVSAGPMRRVVAVVGGLLILIAGVLLAIDGVHWVTDVVASVIWSAAVAPFVYLLWTQWVLPRVPASLLGRSSGGRRRQNLPSRR